MRADERLSVALADAMLAGPWELAGLLARCRRVIGRSHSWLMALVSEVVTAYQRPPADRPRELAAFVLASAALRKARPGDRAAAEAGCPAEQSDGDGQPTIPGSGDRPRR